MKRRFSQQELFELRNQVPITGLMQHVLALPTRQEQGKKRYKCPLCAGYDTSVNYDHNLLRCFDCKRNFNPIDLAMNCLKIEFVDSVGWLKEQLATRVYVEYPTGPREKTKQAIPIGQVLKDILPARSPEKKLSETKQNVAARVDRLESKMDQLFDMVTEIKDLMKA